MVGLDIKDKKFGYLTPIELIPEDSRINSYKRRGKIKWWKENI